MPKWSETHPVRPPTPRQRVAKATGRADVVWWSGVFILYVLTLLVLTGNPWYVFVCSIAFIAGAGVTWATGRIR